MAPAALRCPPLTFFEEVAEPLANLELFLLREVRVTPRPEGAAATWRV